MSKSYIKEVVTELKKIEELGIFQEHGYKIESFGCAHGKDKSLPLCCIRPIVFDDNKKNILISAGVHGDEPAGVYAALKFIKYWLGPYKEDYQFVIFPCMNPFGFEANTLETESGHNLNRQFGIESSIPEARTVESYLRYLKKEYVMTFDLHEIEPSYEGEGFTPADNPTDCYLYETITDNSPKLGSKMIESLPKHLDYCHWPEIYEDISVDGVVSYPEGLQNAVYSQQTNFDGYLNGRYTSHSFTNETPVGWPMPDRIVAHMVFLVTALGE